MTDPEDRSTPVGILRARVVAAQEHDDAQRAIGAKKEREKIVAWLRGQGVAARSMSKLFPARDLVANADAFEDAADHIEAGAHTDAQPPGMEEQRDGAAD